MFKIKANFIGSFKLGDNINHNLRILKFLYSIFYKEDDNNKRLLCKPIIIIMASIVEAILHDFHNRIRSYTKEGVSSLTNEVISYIRGKNIKDEFEKYIESARTHDFFDARDTKFYDALHGLRKLRNRIHIQNRKNSYEPDEYVAFNEKRKVITEKLLEKTVKTMNERHHRAFSGFVEDFEFPWEEHYPSLSGDVVEVPKECPYCAFPAEDNTPEIAYQCPRCLKIF